MVTPKYIIVFKVSINGLTIYKSESLAVTNLSFIVEMMYQSDL